MRRWLLLLSVLAGGCSAHAQGAVTAYVQDTEPANPPFGATWYAPTSGTFKVVTSTNPVTWGEVGGGDGGESLPSGAIVLIASGTCPSGYTEVADFDGKALVGTIAANKDIGGTGGSDSITPEGSNSTPTFTGDAITDVVSHTHVVDVTDPGHAHVENQNSATTGGLTGWAARDTSTNNASATDYSTASATTGITASTDAPAGSVASVTPTGTVSAPTFTGTQFDNRSAFVRVIACEKS